MARAGRTTGRVTYGRLIFSALPPADPLPSLLKSWANRVRVLVYNRSTRIATPRFVPLGVQVVDNFIPFKVNPKQPTPRAFYRPINRLVVQTQSVLVPLPIKTRGMTHVPHPYVQQVRRHVLALGPAAYIPIRSVTKSRTTEKVRTIHRFVPYQSFVPVASAPRIHFLASPTRRIRCPYPIQPNTIPVRMLKTRFVHDVHKTHSRVFPLEPPEPIVLHRLRPHATVFPINRPPRHIPFNTPATVLPRNRVQHVMRNGVNRNVTRYIPGAVQSVPLPVHGRPKFVAVPKIGFRVRSLVFQGVATTVQSPIFVGSRVRQKTVAHPLRRPAAVIAAPQAVIVVRSTKTRTISSVKRRSGFPFAIGTQTVTPVLSHIKLRQYPVHHAIRRQPAIVQSLFPIFVHSRPQHRIVGQPIHRPTKFVQAPQAVVVVRSVKMFAMAGVRRRSSFPFAVDRAVNVPVPFPVTRNLPRWVRIPYPKLQRYTVAAFPPPTVEQIVLTNRRVVR